MGEGEGGPIGQRVARIAIILCFIAPSQTLAVGERAHARRPCSVAAAVLLPALVEFVQGHGRVRNVRVARGQSRTLVEALMDGVGPGVSYGCLIRQALCSGKAVAVLVVVGVVFVLKIDEGAVGKDCWDVLGQERGHFAATADASGGELLNATN